MAINDLAFSDIYTDVGEFLYSTRTLSDAQKTEAKRITNRGYGFCLSDYDWFFLKPRASLAVAVTDTDTASGAPSKDNGTSTVTSAAALFDPLMVDTDVTFSATDEA